MNSGSSSNSTKESNGKSKTEGSSSRRIPFLSKRKPDPPKASGPAQGSAPTTDASSLGGALNNMKISLAPIDEKQGKSDKKDDKNKRDSSKVLKPSTSGSSASGKEEKDTKQLAPFDKVIMKANGLTLVATGVVGNGSFGVVVKATVQETGDTVAIKKVLQDKRYKNRELQIMQMLNHPNIVQLKNSFYTSGDKPDEVFLNLVLEFLPDTVYRVCRHYSKLKTTLPMIYTKLYTYQMLRALSYIHSLGICHRDIKPQNLLLDPSAGVLKLCDFGSAKILVKGEPNVSYICSRYYRAPELIFGSTTYSASIDVWSAGCVLAELLTGTPLFPGESGVDQLVEIIKILGTPTREEVEAMNPAYTEYKFPPIKGNPWPKVFKQKTPPDAIDLVGKLLQYTPVVRLRPLEACAHPFFDEIRNPATTLPNGVPLPPHLFSFSEAELKDWSHLVQKLIPPHATK